MLQCQLWPPALPGQLLVLLSSWEGLWPCLPCQGQAELTAPLPGCQHHSSSSAGISIAAETAAGSLCEESHAHLETAATPLLGLLLPTLHQTVYSAGYLLFSVICLAFLQSPAMQLQCFGSYRSFRPFILSFHNMPPFKNHALKLITRT